MVTLTSALARTALSQDMSDYFSSTTTSSGATTTTNDTLLANFDDDIFVGKFDTFILAVDGTNAGTWRRVTSKTGAALTHAAFANTMASGVAYEIHRLATPDEKDTAITRALNLLNGTILFKRSFTDVTIVADQYDYDVPSGFYRNQVRQIHMVSEGDSEITQQLFNWSIRTGSDGAHDIHFEDLLRTGASIRVWGHQVLVIGDMDDGDGFSQILSARAAVLLFTDIIANAPNEQVQRYTTLLGVADANFKTRLTTFSEPGIPLGQLIPGMTPGRRDRDFGTV